MKIFLNKTNFFILIILCSFQFISSKFISFKLEQYQHSQEYINLINFIKSNGGYINPKLTINENSITNRYILAQEKIYEKEKLLFIPEKILISKLHINVNKICNEAYGYQEDHDYDCLVYYITIDKYNKSSLFKPYYDFLPKIDYKDFIISLTDEELNLLNETDLSEGISTFNHFYKIALDPVKEKLQNFAKKNHINFSKILEDFKQNFLLVGTRNFGRPDSFADFSTMVPFLDLLNHSDKNNTYWFYDEIKNGYFLIAMKDIEKNEEVTDSYGRYCNSALYKTYGFVIPGNSVNDRLYVKIKKNIFRLDMDFFEENIYYIFDKFDYDKISFSKAKNLVLEVLYKKKDYFNKIKINREAIKIIIKEYNDIIDAFINKINTINSFSYIKNRFK